MGGRRECREIETRISVTIPVKANHASFHLASHKNILGSAFHSTPPASTTLQQHFASRNVLKDFRNDLTQVFSAAKSLNPIWDINESLLLKLASVIKGTHEKWTNKAMYITRTNSFLMMMILTTRVVGVGVWGSKSEGRGNPLEGDCDP